MTQNSLSMLGTLAVALLFAVIFLFGGRLAYRPGQKGRRRFLSFAAGISVSYTFVHVLPTLQAIREFQRQSAGDFNMMFPEHNVYLWTLVGFLVFYGLENLAASTRQEPENHGRRIDTATPWQAWMHMGGFALYTGVLTHMMVWTGKTSLALCLFAVAMGMHLFTITCSLSSHYPLTYERRGAYLLALASLAGWASAVTLNIPIPILLSLVAFVIGGIVVNTAIAELPRDREGRYWSFLAGAATYTALLLILFHFEQGNQT